MKKSVSDLSSSLPKMNYDNIAAESRIRQGNMKSNKYVPPVFKKLNALKPLPSKSLPSKSLHSSSSSSSSFPNNKPSISITTLSPTTTSSPNTVLHTPDSKTMKEEEGRTVEKTPGSPSQMIQKEKLTILPKLSFDENVVPPLPKVQNSLWDEDDFIPFVEKVDPLNQKNQLWIEKYRPTKLNEIYGHTKIKQELSKWILDRSKYDKTKNVPTYALLTGPPGIGKTTLAHVILKNFGYDVVECNASDIRTVSKIIEFIHQSCELVSMSSVPETTTGDLMTQQQPKIGQGRIALIIDEVDGIFEQEGSEFTTQMGSMNQLIQFLTTGDESFGKLNFMSAPIIMIANDAFKLKNLKDYALHLRMWTLDKSDIQNIFASTFAKEKPFLTQEQKNRWISEKNRWMDECQGDGRLLLNILQTHGCGKSKNLHPSPFEIAGKLLYASKPSSSNSTIIKSNETQRMDDIVAGEYGYLEHLIHENYLSTFVPSSNASSTTTKQKEKNIKDLEMLDELIHISDGLSELDIQNVFISSSGHAAINEEGIVSERGMEYVLAPQLVGLVSKRQNKITFDYEKQSFYDFKKKPDIQKATFFELRNAQIEKASEINEALKYVEKERNGITLMQRRMMAQQLQKNQPEKYKSYQEEILGCMKKGSLNTFTFDHREPEEKNTMTPDHSGYDIPKNMFLIAPDDPISDPMSKPQFLQSKTTFNSSPFQKKPFQTSKSSFSSLSSSSLKRKSDYSSFSKSKKPFQKFTKY